MTAVHARALRLRKETLTDLTDAELGAVAGAEDTTVDTTAVLSRVRTLCYSCVSLCIKP